MQEEPGHCDRKVHDRVYFSGVNIQQSVLTSFDAISKKAQKQLLKQIDGELFEQDSVMLARENR